MIIKNLPEDFKVFEINDFDKLKEIKKEKNEIENKFYYFFEIEKINKSHFLLIKILSEYFKVKQKFINYSGTKDKNAITHQVICIRKMNFNLKTICENINKNEDFIKIKYLFEDNFRLNLGDNFGNKFEIKIIDISKEEMKNFEKNVKNKIIEKGILNFFEKQRFGFSFNNHIVGKYLLKNEFKKAIFEILTSLPQNPKEDLKEFCEFVKENFEKIFDEDNLIDLVIKKVPKNFYEYKKILEKLKQDKNNFLGAIKTLPKKLLTLYYCSYQSFLFNEILKNNLDEIKDFEELELINKKVENEKLKKIYEKYLLKDNLDFEDFDLKKFDFKFKKSFRKVFTYPKNFSYKVINEKEIIINFDLEKGEYATNIINQLFYK